MSNEYKLKVKIIMDSGTMHEVHIETLVELTTGCELINHIYKESKEGSINIMHVRDIHGRGLAINVDKIETVEY